MWNKYRARALLANNGNMTHGLGAGAGDRGHHISDRGVAPPSWLNSHYALAFGLVAVKTL